MWSHLRSQRKGPLNVHLTYLQRLKSCSYNTSGLTEGVQEYARTGHPRNVTWKHSGCVWKLSSGSWLGALSCGTHASTDDSTMVQTVSSLLWQQILNFDPLMVILQLSKTEISRAPSVVNLIHVLKYILYNYIIINGHLCLKAHIYFNK